MATRKTTKPTARSSGKSTTKRRSTKASSTFTAEEKAAMKATARERRSKDPERDLLDAIRAMPADERAIAQRIHELVMTAAPDLQPKTWYGMPAWANADGKVVCFFQGASKFKARYSTFGFNDTARLDSGSMWATSFALTRLTKAGEADIRRLVKQAVG